MKLLAVLFLAACFLHAQDANPFSADAPHANDQAKSNILKSAEKIPEENYSFKPAPRVRTFGQILGHLAEEQYLYCGTAKGERKAADVEKAKTAKADLLAALQESFAYCDAVYAALTDATAAETVQIGQSQRTRLHILCVNTLHVTSPYGNLVPYLRIICIVP